MSDSEFRELESAESDFGDRQIACIDCGGEFTWTAGEQEFFHEKGFNDPPKRCKECRQAKKADRNQRSNRGE